MKKKIIIFILSLIILISIIKLLPIKKHNKENITKEIKLGEVTHSVFYAPLYIAIENNYFKEEQLNVKLSLISGADKVSAAVISKDIDIGFAGAESAIYIYEKKPKDYIQIFAGLTKRDGQFIVSKEKIQNFKLTDLYGKEILVGRSSGMPALNFLNALKKEGIDKNKININYSIDFASLSGAYIAGTGDYVNLFEPNASKLEEANYGYVVQSIGQLSGPMPYTTFYALKSYINNNEDVIIKFRKAINKALDFTKENTSKEIANIIKPQFPDLSINNLTKIVDRYKKSDCWLKNTYRSEELLLNLENLLLDNNLIKSYIDYKNLILN